MIKREGMCTNLYLRLPGNDRDAILATLELLVADERPDVDRHFHAAILSPAAAAAASFHRYRLGEEALADSAPERRQVDRNALRPRWWKGGQTELRRAKDQLRRREEEELELCRRSRAGERLDGGEEEVGGRAVEEMGEDFREKVSD